ncbi:fumarylacetoacetate hydrolase family protein [Streptomyces hirsutus]|uniref:fumarylacetoacetate hydrolase family protein n=1 Tax=Streptomyces hirsutus TaxID=35620 RepID=UPI0036805622
MRFGVLDDRLIAVLPDGAAHDVTGLAGPPTGPAGPLQRLIERGRPLSAAEVRTAPAVDVGGAAWDAPLPFPRKVIGAPANYRAHVAEMGNPNTIVEWGVFLKASTSVIGPGRTVELPYTDVRTDQEGELAVVIGKEARHVSASDALDYVFGYTCVLDITTRSTEDRSTRKSYDTFTPLGPLVVTPEEVGDPDDLALRCWVGGELRQDSNTSRMIYGVSRLIAYASSVMTLQPGDVIATGTPEGVGPLADGDEIVVEIERVGRLAVTVSAAGALPYGNRMGMPTA